MRKTSFDSFIFVVILLMAFHFFGRKGQEKFPEKSQSEIVVDDASEFDRQSRNASQQGDELPSEASEEYADADFEEPEDIGDEVPDGLEIPEIKGFPVLRRTGFTTAYSSQTRCPVWTAWHLTSHHTNGPYKRKGVKYHEDEEVYFPKATNADYAGSGYDRGHMCPSGDNKWSSEAQEDCFLFTNMCPQSHNLNGGDWNDLEMKCRKWAEKYGDIYIVCGPVFKSTHHKTIGKNKVAVPDGFYKVVLCMRGEPKAIGFYYENDDGHAPMADYVCSVDEIERLTGIDFFHRLDDETERRIEAQARFEDW